MKLYFKQKFFPGCNFREFYYGNSFSYHITNFRSMHKKWYGDSYRADIYNLISKCFIIYVRIECFLRGVEGYWKYHLVELTNYLWDLIPLIFRMCNIIFYSMIAICCRNRCRTVALGKIIIFWKFWNVPWMHLLCDNLNSHGIN